MQPDLSPSVMNEDTVSASTDLVWTAERLARIGLAATGPAGDCRWSKLIAEYGAVSLWQQLRSGRADSPWRRRAQTVEPDALRQQTESHGMRFIIPGDQEWPPLLNDLVWIEPLRGLGGLPVGLWLLGPKHLDQLTVAGLAVVGARASTAYGEQVATELAAGLAERGYPIISGGAYGIDAAAHRAALAVGGQTVSLMAGGLNRLYPSGNSRLLERLRAEQLLVSEYPPDWHPAKPHFLARNRLIAALAVASLVVEGRARSGAANTAAWAQAIGRPLLAVPGPVTSANSVTPHRLIRNQQAVLVSSIDDIRSAIEPLQADMERWEQEPPRPIDRLSAGQTTVLEALPGRGDGTVDQLVMVTGLTANQVLEHLVVLANLELVQPNCGGWRLTKAARRSGF